MTRYLILVLLAVTLGTAPAKETGPSGAATIRVENERSPRGGRALVRLSMTEPRPIIVGEAMLQFDPSVLTSVAGAAALSDSQNVMGAGTFDMLTGSVQTRFTSTDQNFGMSAALPIVVVALNVSPNAPDTATSPLTVNPATMRLVDPASQPYVSEVKQGTFTVGGVSIDEVVPPTGTAPAGSTIIVRGKGFQSGADVAIEGVTGVGATQFVSSSELRVPVQTTFAIEGKQFRVRNPDRTEDLFFSYTPSAAQPAADPLLARTIPFFGRQTFARASVTFPTLLAAGAKALAFQNPESDTAQIGIELFSASNERLGQGSAQITRRGVPVLRSLAELVPGVQDARVRTAVITSSAPIRVLGIQTDPATAGVNPIPPAAAAQPVLPQVNAGGVVSAASYQPGLAPGNIVAIFGANFAASEAQANSIPWPTDLGGVKVTMGGVAAPLYYAGPNQINAQVPWNLPAGAVPVVVTTAAGASVPISIAGGSEAPGLLSQDRSGRGAGAIVDALTGALITPANPIARDGVATIYCLGLGAVTNTPVSGSAALSDPLSQTLATPQVTIGGVPAKVLFSGLSPGSVSLYQINVEIPEGAPAGEAVEVRVTVNGTASNAVTIAIQ